MKNKESEIIIVDEKLRKESSSEGMAVAIQKERDRFVHDWWNEEDIYLVTLGIFYLYHRESDFAQITFIHTPQRIAELCVYALDCGLKFLQDEGNDLLPYCDNTIKYLETVIPQEIRDEMFILKDGRTIQEFVKQPDKKKIFRGLIDFWK